ncbi:unnamed protein product [Fusarium fujikuroi]|nr:unnamed protein product [Fusarium fujikuroi]
MPNGDCFLLPTGHGDQLLNAHCINCKSKLAWLVQDDPGRGLDSQQSNRHRNVTKLPLYQATGNPIAQDAVHTLASRHKQRALPHLQLGPCWPQRVLHAVKTTVHRSDTWPIIAGRPVTPPDNASSSHPQQDNSSSGEPPSRQPTTQA